jgi:chloramphenicol-sensitive protein RarD
VLIASNWYAYLWLVSEGRVIEAALGYFINPLMSVLLGAVVLRERLSPLQWLAIGLATAGVTWIGWRVGHMPWASLFIAATFSAYGLVRKVAPLGPLEGLTLESLVLTPVALLLLAWLHRHGQDRFIGAALGQQGLILLSGVVTAAPLLLFAASTRKIPMSWVGMLQYFSPTVQTLIGVLVFGDVLGSRLQGFALIWSGCVLFSLDLLRSHRRGALAGPANAATMTAEHPLRTTSSPTEP